LLHAARLHARLKGRAATYKFSRRRYRALRSSVRGGRQERRAARSVGHAA
jgi:hypothetical protein